MKKFSENPEPIPVKPCYDHVGGKLSNLLMEQFIEKGWIAKKSAADKYFYITEKGKKEFTRLAIDLSLIK